MADPNPQQPHLAIFGHLERLPHRRGDGSMFFGFNIVAVGIANAAAESPTKERRFLFPWRWTIKGFKVAVYVEGQQDPHIRTADPISLETGTIKAQLLVEQLEGIGQG